MVNLTRIYTRTGDDGTTSLGDMSRTGKTDPRLQAYADVDEANSTIGYALALGDVPPGIAALLGQIQNDLFDVGADLCTPIVADPAVPPLRVTGAYVDSMNPLTAQYLNRLSDLLFILAREANTPASGGNGDVLWQPGQRQS